MNRRNLFKVSLVGLAALFVEPVVAKAKPSTPIRPLVRVSRTPGKSVSILETALTQRRVFKKRYIYYLGKGDKVMVKRFDDAQRALKMGY